MPSREVYDHSMYDIAIADSQQSLALDETFLREVVERVLAEEQVVAAEISIALVDNPAMRELNRQYLNHDYDTDVLSFLLDCEVPEVVEAAGHTPRGAGKRIEGEVIVSTEMAAQMAADFGWSPRDEAVLYLVHGLLHLAGYDDLTGPEKELMRQRERQLLAIWNLTPGYADEAAGDDDPPHSGPAWLSGVPS